MSRGTPRVDPSVRRLADYFATEPVRVSATLRLPLIALIAILVWIWEVDHWLPELYAVILGVYAVAAVLWLVAVLRGPVPRWADWASTIVDLMVIVALCLVSGGATSALLPVSLTPSLMGLSGPTYFVVALLLGLGFLFFSLRFAIRRTRRDARSLFLASIAYLPLVWIAMIADRL